MEFIHRALIKVKRTRHYSSSSDRLFLFILATILANTVNSQSEPVMSQAYMLSQTAAKFHIEPRTLDGKASEYIFNEFLRQIDESGTVLTQEDIEELSSFKSTLATAIQKQDPAFLTKTKHVYLRALGNAQKIIGEIQNQPLDFQAWDTLSFKPEKPYVRRADLSRKWSQWVKYGILNDYFGSFDSLPEVPMITPEKATGLRDKMLKESIESIQKRLNSTELLDKKLNSFFLSALSTAYDPHTSFFSAPEKNEFLEMLSDVKVSYGINCEMNAAGEVEIINVIPGSTAWNSNEINEGDVIVSVTPLRGKEKSFEGITMKEAHEFIASEKLNEATFKIRKKSGQLSTVALFKSVISVEENRIDSYILDGPVKIGYISLPGFYTSEDGGGGCANDVAKELIHLKKEGIQGLVFDLRNNGGGSLGEAIKLTGMFINYGAISIMDNYGEEPTTIKDMDKGSVFDGPLIVLVNRLSASASEFFAAAMQDYNRGLIVGGHTYGKSTSQIILAVDAYKTSSLTESTSDKGYVKLTTGKFYRCTGKTHQKEGVQPDVHLPDIFDYINYGERYEPNALSATPIDKKTYYYPLAPFPIENLSSNSQARIAASKNFENVKTKCQKYADLYNKGQIPVSFAGYSDYYRNFAESDKSDLKDKNLSIKPRIPDYILSLGQLSEANKKIRNKVILELESDIYLDESYHIIHDLIQFKNH